MQLRCDSPEAGNFPLRNEKHVSINDMDSGCARGCFERGLLDAPKAPVLLGKYDRRERCERSRRMKAGEKNVYYFAAIGPVSQAVVVSCL